MYPTGHYVIYTQHLLSICFAYYIMCEASYYSTFDGRLAKQANSTSYVQSAGGNGNLRHVLQSFIFLRNVQWKFDGRVTEGKIKTHHFSAVNSNELQTRIKIVSEEVNKVQTAHYRV